MYISGLLWNPDTALLSNQKPAVTMYALLYLASKRARYRCTAHPPPNANTRLHCLLLLNCTTTTTPSIQYYWWLAYKMQFFPWRQLAWHSDKTRHLRYTRHEKNTIIFIHNGAHRAIASAAASYLPSTPHTSHALNNIHKRYLDSPREAGAYDDVSSSR